MNKVARFLAALLIVANSPAPALALCLLPRPPIKYRRAIDAFTSSVSALFTNDGQFYGNPGWSSEGCISSGLVSGYEDAGISISPPDSTPQAIWVTGVNSNGTLFGRTWVNPANGPTVGATIEIPVDISLRSGFDCDRIKKLIRHEVGHTLGLNHPEDALRFWDRFPRWIPSIMHKGIDAIYSGIDDLPLNPTCGDINAVKEAKNHTGPPQDYLGDAGGIIDCSFGISDSGTCCHPRLPELYAPSVGHMNRKPVSAVEAPANNSTFVFGASIDLKVHAFDEDGRVNRVNWAYRLVGGSWQYPPPLYTYPFDYTVQNLPPGTYEVRADAYDTADTYTVSPSVFFTVAPPPTAPEVLPSNGILYPNQYRLSANGQFGLVYQADGNLVLYALPSWNPILWTATVGNGATYMNPSGNLEVYNSISPLILGWQSLTGSPGNAGSYLWVKNDGHVALVRPNGTLVAQWP